MPRVHFKNSNNITTRQLIRILYIFFYALAMTKTFSDSVMRLPY